MTRVSRRLVQEYGREPTPEEISNKMNLSVSDARRVREQMVKFNRVLAVLEEDPAETNAEIERLVEERQAARRARDFARADAIRDELLAKGIILEDTRDGVRWKRAT